MSNQELIKFNSERKIQHSQWSTLYLIIYDIFAVSFSYFGALWLRFDLRFSMIPEAYLHSWLTFAGVYAVVCIIVFWLFRLYRSIWRFASFKELQRIILATFVTITLFILRMPISYYIMGAFLQFVMLTGIRFAYRFVLLLRHRNSEADTDNCMLIGMHSIIGTT